MLFLLSVSAVFGVLPLTVKRKIRKSRKIIEIAITSAADWALPKSRWHSDPEDHPDSRHWEREVPPSVSLVRKHAKYPFFQLAEVGPNIYLSVERLTNANRDKRLG